MRSASISPLLGVVSGGAAAVVSVAFLAVAWPSHWYAFLIFGLPLVGGVIAVLRPISWIALLVAAAFITFGAYQLLLGMMGLLYLPSLIFLLVGAVVLKRARRA